MCTPPIPRPAINRFLRLCTCARYAPEIRSRQTSAAAAIPLRRPRSRCRPAGILLIHLRMTGASRFRVRTASAPTPRGPPNLCADTEIISAPAAAISSCLRCAPHRYGRGRRRPGRCGDQSDPAGPPQSRCWRASQRPVPCRAASPRDAGVHVTGGLRVDDVTLTPNSASALAFSRIDECSIEVVTRCRRTAARRTCPTTPRCWTLLPPEVRTISPGLVPNIDAMDRRASCNAAAAARPAPCALEGIAHQ